MKNRDVEAIHQNNYIINLYKKFSLQTQFYKNSFYRKKDAIEHSKENENLISEDYCYIAKNNEIKFSKRFYNISHSQLYEIIIKQKNNRFLYENYESCQKLKLFLDIDNYTNCNFKTLLIQIIQDIEKNIGFKLKALVLISNKKNKDSKNSAHIIFQNVTFDNIHIIKNTNDIDKFTYKLLLKNKSTNDLMNEDYNLIDRYLFRKLININIGELTDSDIDKYYKLQYEIKNFKYFIKDEITFDEDDQNKAKRKSQKKIILKLLKALGFNNLFDSIEISKDIFIKRWYKMIKKNDIINDIDSFCILFNIKKVDINEFDNDTRKILGFINSLFNRFGFRIICKQKTERNNKSKINISYYKIKLYTHFENLLNY
jgi:hypothetical protein